MYASTGDISGSVALHGPQQCLHALDVVSGRCMWKYAARMGTSAVSGGHIYGDILPDPGGGASPFALDASTGRVLQTQQVTGAASDPTVVPAGGA